MLIRKATVADAPAMADLLNQIIAIGGTTAHQHPKSIEDIKQNYIVGPDCITCVVALLGEVLIGWQAIGWWQAEAHIGTFVTPNGQARGVGVQMFAQTLTLARRAGLRDIHAAIRADNAPGLAYYARIGFVDDSLDPGFALTDGRVVGRVNRRFTL
jgi:L-amino acid N-acyltransferase YncA